ncbi:MAG TPA: cache domain-containing protein [Pyrinomonadaceae bacterium]|nr:cache domain-containing protein [Pyrinomonadaceae bacterium]
MAKSSTRAQLRVIAFTLVLIIVPFFVYYYFWVSNQTKYFNGRNLRTLATLSTHLQESVESQSFVFKNAVEKYVQDLADGEFSENGRPITLKQLKQDEKDYIEQFQEKALNPFRVEAGANLQATGLSVVAKPADESLLSAPSIEVKEEASERWLYFEYTVPYIPAASGAAGHSVASAIKPTSKPAASPNTEYLKFQSKINLTQLINPFVNKREMQENQGSLYQDGFDAVLIAELDEQMTILFRESSAKLRMLSLNNLTSNTGGKIDLKSLGQSTNLSDVSLGPADYKLFVQPIQLPLLKANGKNQESLRWLACGLVENVHFQQQRLAISYNVLIGFGFITVLVAVSWSFLKLLFIGPKDRFRALDGYLLGLSAFMIAALLTLGALFTYSYNATLNVAEDGLEQFSGSIKRNFYSELEDALLQIDALNNKLDNDTITAAKNDNTSNPDKLAFRSSIISGDGAITPQSFYPYLNSAFWVNEQGWQRIKWTARSSVSNRLKVSDREYFWRLKQGRQYSYKQHEFWIDAVTSKTTGQHTVVISKRTNRIDPNSLWVSAIDMRLVSLMNPVIPEGFGYAVIDDTGKVLFHSAPKLHLGENLFEECDNNQELRAAVLGRWKQTLTTPYFGKGHSAYVEPFDNLPWTLVVFNEKDSLRTTFGEILTLGLVLFLSYFVVLCLLLAAMYAINRKTRDRSTWLWPDQSKRTLYVNLIVVNVGLFLLSAFAVYELPGLWKLFLPTVIGLAAVALSFWRFKRAECNDEQVKQRWFDYRTAYMVNVTLLFCLASILPAYACFKIAYVQEMKLFIKNGQLKLSDDMVAREDRLRAQSRSVYRSTPKQTVENLLDRRLAEQRDVYDAFFFNTTQNEQPAAPTYVDARPSRLLAFFRGFVPIFDHSSIKRHALTTRAADNSRTWDDSNGTSLVLHAREPQANGQGSMERRIESHLPRLSGASWWLLLLIVFVLTSILLYYMIRQLFLLGRAEPTGDELTGYCANATSPNLLVVLNPAFIGKSQLLQRMGVNGAKRIDIEKIARQKTWGEHANIPKSNDLVVLDNFEYGTDDSHQNQQKLLLLEALLRNKRRTIALSTVDPERLMSTNGKNGHTNGSSATLPVPLFSERWTNAVSSFLKVAPEDLGDVDSFALELGESKKQLLAQPGANKEAIESAFKLIGNECSPRAYLQKVGRTIAGQSCLDKASAAALCKQIMTNARPYYSSLWNACTGEEKLTLTRLAQHGLLSPKDPDSDELIRRGLIVRDPALRIMNESFRLFILSMGTDEAIERCEAEAKSSSNWEALKVPLTIGLLSVAAFLLLTQRELYNSALPFITGLAAGLPSFLKLVSLFQSGSGAKAG